MVFCMLGWALIRHEIKQKCTCHIIVLNITWSFSMLGWKFPNHLFLHLVHIGWILLLRANQHDKMFFAFILIFKVVACDFQMGSFMEDTKYDSYCMIKYEYMGPKMCARVCMRTKFCTGINHIFEPVPTCELCDVLIRGSGNLFPTVVGSRFYNITTWTPVSLKQMLIMFIMCKILFMPCNIKEEEFEYNKGYIDGQTTQ